MAEKALSEHTAAQFSWNRASPLPQRERGLWADFRHNRPFWLCLGDRGGEPMKRQKCAGGQGRHLVKLRELEGYPRGMHRWVLIWLLVAALAVLADEASASRHKHLSRHRGKAVEVEHHKRPIEKSRSEETTPLPPDVAAAKQAIDLVRRHKTKDATTLATSNGDPV